MLKGNCLNWQSAVFFNLFIILCIVAQIEDYAGISYALFKDPVFTSDHIVAELEVSCSPYQNNHVLSCVCVCVCVLKVYTCALPL